MNIEHPFKTKFLLDIKTQNVIANCAIIVTDNDIIDFAQLSCEDPNLMDFMVGGNDDALNAENNFCTLFLILSHYAFL